DGLLDILHLLSDLLQLLLCAYHQMRNLGIVRLGADRGYLPVQLLQKESEFSSRRLRPVDCLDEEFRMAPIAHALLGNIELVGQQYYLELEALFVDLVVLEK